MLEGGQDIARPQRLQLEGIVDWSLGLAVGRMLVVDVHIVLRQMVIRVRNHVLRLGLLVNWLGLLVNWLRIPVNWLRLLVNWFRLLVNWVWLLVNWVWLLVHVGRGLIVIIRWRRPIARGGCGNV